MSEERAANPLSTVLTEQQRKADWLEARRHVLTGTDLAAIMGLGSFGKTPLTVWLDKKGLAEPVAETDAMRWGKKLEPLVLGEFTERTGIVHVPADPYHLFVNVAQAPIGATLDAWAAVDGHPIEAKTTGFLDDEWGEEGTDRVPTGYLLQVAAQLHVTGQPFAHLAAFFLARRETRIYRIERDLDLESVLLERAATWWKRHIVGDEQPEIDGSRAATDYITRRFPRNVAPLTEASEEATALAAELRQVRLYQDDIKAKRDELENKLKAIIGDAEGIQGPFGKLTWKANKDSEAVDYQAIAEVYLASLDGARRAALLKDYTTTKPGARVLRPTWAKENA